MPQQQRERQEAIESKMAKVGQAILATREGQFGRACSNSQVFSCRHLTLGRVHKLQFYLHHAPLWFVSGFSAPPNARFQSTTTVNISFDMTAKHDTSSGMLMKCFYKR